MLPSLSQFLAWMVHFITATGVVFGLFTLIAVAEGQWIVAFIWMAVSLAVDSVDGTLARLFKVKEVLPGFDGALLDNMADFLTYVVVPAYFLYEARLLPDTLSILAAVVIVLVSSYQFCQSDAKTEDHYFKGFPSYWNIVVFYLFFLQMNEWVNLAVIVALACFVFVPIKYVYPSRAPRYQYLTLSLAAVWGALCAVLLNQFPDYDPWLVWASLLFVVYYVGISVHLMFKPS